MSTWMQFPDNSYVPYDQIVSIKWERKYITLNGKKRRVIVSCVNTRDGKTRDFISDVWKYASIHKESEVFHKKNIDKCHQLAISYLTSINKRFIDMAELPKMIWERWNQEEEPTKILKSQRGVVHGLHNKR